MKQEVSACARRQLPGDRMVRVQRRPRGWLAGILSSISGLFRFGSSPRAR